MSFDFGRIFGSMERICPPRSPPTTWESWVIENSFQPQVENGRGKSTAGVGALKVGVEEFCCV